MRILFMGSGDIALPSFQWLMNSPDHTLVGVITQPDKPVGRHQVLTPPAIKILAQTADLPVFQPVKVRSTESLAALSSLQADLILVMAYGQLLPPALLDLPKIACLNLHASLLPRHRGASPIQAAILAGDITSGITLMHMDVGLDTGDSVLAHKIALAPDETGGTLHDKIAHLGPGVLAEALPLFAAGTAPRQPQNAALATHCGKLTRESGQIDWTQSTAHLERLIRAYQPWPGTHSTLPNGKKIKIHRAHPVAGQGRPGEILSATPGALHIATRDGALCLDEIQPEGRPRMSAADFLRGHFLPVSDFMV